MIYVCDAIMGSGKTQAAMNYMNSHPERRFLYVTPYLDEAERIAKGCPGLHFAAPQNLEEFNGSKVEHTMSLIEQGRNVATTHQAIRHYSEGMLRATRDFGYTMIIDESLQTIEPCGIFKDDANLLKAAGMLEDSGDGTGKLRVVCAPNYKKGRFNDFMFVARSQYLTIVSQEERGKSSEILADVEAKPADGSDNGAGVPGDLIYWTLSPELFSSFEDVFILTYLFESMDIYGFMKMYGIGYGKIGVRVDGSPEGYSFCDGDGYVPEYTKRIRELIDVLEDDKLNSVGRRTTALSRSWFCNNRGNGNVDKLKNNIYNVFRNVWHESGKDTRMWATFTRDEDGKKGKSRRSYGCGADMSEMSNGSWRIDCKPLLKGKGYTGAFVSLNARASNNYRNRKYLVYACNLYMNVGTKIFFQKNGVEFSDDKYALSVMLQWIWRSAIRDGEKIHLYLPSSRMRRILYEWMDSTSGEGGEVPVGRGFDSGTNAA